jgi:hypothetical protein
MNPTPVTEYDIRQLKADGDLNAYLHQAIAAARAIRDRQRALVLRHHDLADRLTQPPISFARPDCWTGYIQPEHLATGQPNRSPIRTALLEIVTEAEQRRAS